LSPDKNCATALLSRLPNILSTRAQDGHLYDGLVGEVALQLGGAHGRELHCLHSRSLFRVWTLLPPPSLYETLFRSPLLHDLFYTTTPMLAKQFTPCGRMLRCRFDAVEMVASKLRAEL